MRIHYGYHGSSYALTGGMLAELTSPSMRLLEIKDADEIRRNPHQIQTPSNTLYIGIAKEKYILKFNSTGIQCLLLGSGLPNHSTGGQAGNLPTTPPFHFHHDHLHLLALIGHLRYTTLVGDLHRQMGRVGFPRNRVLAAGALRQPRSCNPGCIWSI